MALKCCICSEILMETDEKAILEYAETYYESEGKSYRHTFVSSGYCPDCFDGLVDKAAAVQVEQSAA